MIFYFSATGNSKYVAERLLKVTGGEMISISTCMKTGHSAFMAVQGESVGVVLPVYFWGLPDIAEKFLKKLKLTVPQGTYLYFVATYGTTPGASGAFAARLLGAKGLSFSACFSVKMPDTWTPLFDLSNPDKVAAQNAAAEEQVSFAIEKVSKRMTGDFMQKKAPYLIAKVFARPAYEFARQTFHFTVTADCVSCGLCAEKCPVQAIELRDRKPVWVKKKCTLCLGCLHRCPKFAIQYGSHTEKHGQYQNPYTKV
ncbi:MAG: EFR1 family ferrodoxin [Oscillospiraceae bacterium]|jgi:ferredoxin|nr:EFR1 family ferrodoxin [Oscillospiraceae bacterium]